jgi:hypothetical protein
MTARTLLERAGCLAAELARRSGVSDRYWNTMLTRDTPINTARQPDRSSKMVAWLDEHIKSMQDLRRDLKKL